MFYFDDALGLELHKAVLYGIFFDGVLFGATKIEKMTHSRKGEGEADGAGVSHKKPEAG